MPAPDTALPLLTASLSESAREIDQTFAGVGDRLGRGLIIFDSLNQSLTTLSAELDGQDVEAARAALLGLASDLRQLSGALPRETRTLQDIAQHSGNAAQLLGRLIEHMRLIAILARSARIEAVSVESTQRDFGGFTNEIVALTDRAKRTVETCARDHGHLTTLLDSALLRQRAFETQYGGALAALADKLEQSLDHLAERRGRSAALTRDAAAHSRRISGSVGGAIIALQTGDGIRQRLEHSLAALRLLAELDAGGDPDRVAAAAVLRHLQAAQLHDTARALKADIAPIDDTLQMLGEDTAALLALGRSLFSGEDASSASFLEDLEGELAEAAELIRKCDSARSVVDQFTTSLSGLLEQFEQTVAALAHTVRDIVLIGMNAGLRAARLGSSGRGLVVIAQELKGAANAISLDAGKLTPAFAAMQEASAGLKQRDACGSDELAALARTMRDSLDKMRESGQRLGATLDRLARDGGEFGAIVDEARLMFSNAAATGDVVAGAAGMIGQATPASRALAQADAGAVAGILQAAVWPSYTMAAEREIHDAVLRACGLAGAAAPEPQPRASEALDDILF